MTNLTDNDIKVYCEKIYNRVYSKEDYELCMNYLNASYYQIFVSSNSTERDKITDEIIQFEIENYKELADSFTEEIKEYQNPSIEKIIYLYSKLAFTLASFRIKYKKEYLLAKYCQNALDIILNDKKNAEVCEKNAKIISETLIDFSYATGGNNMSFRIHNIYGDK